MPEKKGARTVYRFKGGQRLGKKEGSDVFEGGGGGLIPQLALWTKFSRTL